MTSSLKLADIDYIRRREAQERAAAKRAQTLAAKRAHQELAQLYAELAGNEANPARLPVIVEKRAPSSRAIDS